MHNQIELITSGRYDTASSACCAALLIRYRDRLSFRFACVHCIEFIYNHIWIYICLHVYTYNIIGKMFWAKSPQKLLLCSLALTSCFVWASFAKHLNTTTDGQLLIHDWRIHCMWQFHAETILPISGVILHYPKQGKTKISSKNHQVYLVSGDLRVMCLSDSPRCLAWNLLMLHCSSSQGCHWSHLPFGWDYDAFRLQAQGNTK